MPPPSCLWPCCPTRSNSSASRFTPWLPAFRYSPTIGAGWSHAVLCWAPVVLVQLGMARGATGCRGAAVAHWLPPLCPQLFSGEVLKMFSTDCKRMSAEIFDQTMPLGKHWRVGLRAGG